MEIVEHCRHRKDRYGGRVRQRDWLHRVLRGHEGDPRCPNPVSQASVVPWKRDINWSLPRHIADHPWTRSKGP